ncbi:MAG: NADH-quinone oxidoreductase subunit N, partial [Bacteroidota bacterium]
MFEQIIFNLQLFLPELILIGTILVAILADLIFKENKSVVVGFVCAGLLSAIYFTFQQRGLNISLFSGMIVIDNFGIFFKLLTLLSTIFIVLFSFSSKEVLNTKSRIGEYYTLLVALALGMALMVSSTHMIMMYLSLEIASLTSYILAGYTKENKNSAEASLKYVLYGAIASGMMLYGISLIYGLTGSLDFYTINLKLAEGSVNPTMLLVSGLLIFVGFGYKISAVPFHYWTPDVYEGSPITITAILSVASKAAGFGMLMRFVRTVFVTDGMNLPFWSAVPSIPIENILILLSILTMTIGNLVAIWQDNLKRLLAYSSIAHAGYMLLGLVVLGNEGYSAVMVYFIVYLFMNLGAFYVVMLVGNETGSENIDDYKGLGARNTFLAISLAIFLISLTGLPPTAGFVGKLYIFAALINSKFIWLAVVGVLNSVVSLYYYVRIFRNMFLRKGESENEIKISIFEKIVLLLLLLPTLILGLYFGPLVEFAQSS